MVATDCIYMPGRIRFYEYPDGNSKIKALGNTITFSVTAGFVLGLKGIYEVIQETIYLYIPLLTMNLMSREYSSGSIKLLYSSPVNSIQIITGKFVSMVVFA